VPTVAKKLRTSKQSQPEFLENINTTIHSPFMTSRKALIKPGAVNKNKSPHHEITPYFDIITICIGIAIDPEIIAE
jgi:hypothetical protein